MPEPWETPEFWARDARADLRALAAAGRDLQIVDREPWRLANVVPEDAREASVLVLLGPLDEADSSSTALGDADVLLLVRAATLRAHAGQPAFPGGKVDPEDRAAPDPAVEAALREAVEETGLDRDGVEVLGPLAPIPLPVSNFMVTPVLAWWREPSAVGVVDAGESARVFRVPLRELLDPAHRHVATVKRGRRTHTSPAFTVETGDGPVTVWGFTGILLDQLVARLGWEIPWDRSRTSAG